MFQKIEGLAGLGDTDSYTLGVFLTGRWCVELIGCPFLAFWNSDTMWISPISTAAANSYRRDSLSLVAKSCPTLAIPWTVACQAPLSMGFSRQEYWNGLPFPFPGDLPDPGIEPGSPALQADSLLTELWGKPHTMISICFISMLLFLRIVWHFLKYLEIP